MKLNPKKCSFGVKEGPFLGHLITKRSPFGVEQGIKVNPSKVKAITDLKPLKTLKEMQNLNKKLAAIRKFLLKGSNKSLSFFKALESCTGKKTLQWTSDANEAFRKMKKFIEILPTLTTPIKGEVLKILARPEKSGRIAKWVVELREHDIEFKGRSSVKGQILADFLAKTPSA
ncbi:hypothetical protein Tco_1013511 [Tanacetum coccineum]